MLSCWLLGFPQATTVPSALRAKLTTAPAEIATALVRLAGGGPVLPNEECPICCTAVAAAVARGAARSHWRQTPRLKLLALANAVSVAETWLLKLFRSVT